MKSLHKKIGVGVLSAALIVGVPMASISFIQQKDQSVVSIVEAFSNQIRVPFLLEHKLKNKREAAINDLKIVHGASKMFDYMIFRINPGDKPERWVQVHNEQLANGMAFLEYLKLNYMKEGMHRVKIGDQLYEIQFYSASHKYKNWLLYLELWQNIQGQALNSYISQLKNI